LCNTGLDSKNLNIKLIKNAKMSVAIVIDTEPVTIIQIGMNRLAGQSSLNMLPIIIMANGYITETTKIMNKIDETTTVLKENVKFKIEINFSNKSN
jgi:hypothetical protein